MTGERGGSRLSRARRRLERWRERNGGPGRPIPEELWAEAVGAARVEGVAVTARALRVDRWRLAKRMAVEPADRAPDGEGDASEGFVEIAASRLGLSGQTVLRFEGRDGERLQVEVSGTSTSVDVVGLAQAFWGRRG